MLTTNLNLNIKIHIELYYTKYKKNNLNTLQLKIA